MKFVLGILLLAVAANGILSGSSNEAEDTIWEHYKNTHGKKYNPNEDVIRKNMFLRKKKSVDEHNELFRNGKESYSKALNKFSDWLPYETAKLRGFKMTEVRSQNNIIYLPPHDGVKMDDSIDWRTKGAVTPVKDQGQCGSCWAFSATGSLEGQHFLKTGNLVSLSEQNIMDCDPKDNSCNGGLIDNAFDYVKDNNGVDTEESYPYIAMDRGTCDFKRENVGASDVGHVNIDYGNETALESAVYQVGPISVSMNSHYLHDYSGGIFAPDQCKTGHRDHAVLIVGYGIETDSTPYWIIKNSWGSSWGEDGYFRMLKGQNMCGVAVQPSYPLV